MYIHMHIYIYICIYLYLETLILVGPECLVLGEAGLSRKLQICKLGTLRRSSKGAFIVARTHSPFPVNTERLSFMNTPNVVGHIGIYQQSNRKGS